jgi:hypothetical protein
MDSSNETTATGPSTALAMGLLGSGNFLFSKNKGFGKQKTETLFFDLQDSRETTRLKKCNERN